MARPKLAVPLDRLLDAYYTAGSLRGAAHILGISRWAVGERLKEAGYTIPSKEEAMSTVRLVQEQRGCYRVKVHVTRWFESELVQFERVPYQPCIIPTCQLERVEYSLCRDHRPLLDAEGGCVWPGCVQESSGAFCYRHEKTVRGLIAS